MKLGEIDTNISSELSPEGLRLKISPRNRLDAFHATKTLRVNLLISNVIMFVGTKEESMFLEMLIRHLRLILDLVLNM